jgi:hypothetical protein
MEAQRVVQILVAGAKRTISSGYQISPTLVLGCRHGVERAGKGGTVFVRGLDDLRRPAEDPSFKGTVQWMGESVDAALIELPATHPAVKRCPKGDVRFARLKQDGKRRLCRGMGFPNATATAVRSNDAYNFTGGRIQRLEETDALLAELEATPPDSAAWAGLSGAAVFYGRVIVGIMRKTHLTIGTNGLEAEPIVRAFDDADFRRHVGGPETIPHVAPFEVSSIRRLACRIDRNKPAHCIKDHLEATTVAAARRWPAIIAVPGSAKQKHRRFMERIAELELKAVTDIDAEPQKILPELKWPQDLHIASNEAYENWLRESWRPLFSEANPLPPKLDDVESCAEKIRDAIQDSALCGFWVGVNSSTVERGTGHGAFLKKWSGLWQTVKNKGIDRPFVIFLCLLDEEPPAKDTRTRRFPWDKLPATEDGPTWAEALAEQFDAGLIFGDGRLELSNLEFSDIRAWADNLSTVIARLQALPAVYSHEIEELMESLQTRLSGPFTMDEFDNKVEDFLRTVRELA